MLELEDPELTFSHGYTKITAIYRATINEKIKKRKTEDLQKRSSTTKDIKKGPQRDEQGDWTCGIVKTNTPGFVNQNWEDNYNGRGSPQGMNGLSPTLGTPSLGVLHWENKPPRTFGFESQ